MHKFITYLSSTLTIAAFSVTALAQPPIPAAPDLGARSWVLMDATTGKVLTSHNADEHLAPASLTKMMTSYIVAGEISEGRLNLDDELIVSTNAWRRGGAKTGGSTMFLNEKSSVSVDDLLHGLIVQSGNDAAIVIAEQIGGTEDNFADMMTQQAQILAMQNTNFTNSTGWPDGNHYSSTHDMALLAQALINDYPEHYQIYARKSFTYNGISQRNRNSLLWQDNSVDGIKTGSTEEAGFCLVASAVRNDMRLITSVMGATSARHRLEASKKLLAWGFRYFRTKTLYQAAEKLQTEPIWKATQDTVDIGLLEAIELTLPRNAGNNIDVELAVHSYLEAPLSYGDEVGKITISLDDEVLYENSIISLENIARSAFFARIWDSISYFFLNLTE